MKKHSACSIICVLVITLLTNGIGISFKGEVYAHELDHIRQVIPLDPAKHLEAHRNNIFWDGAELDAATHLCLHSAGQYQPFYFIHIPLVPVLDGKETLAAYTPLAFPESILELPYHPPREI